LVEAGADAVKLEGGTRQAGKVSTIVKAGIPVMGHLGMLPQRVLEEGGYHKKGKTPEQTTDLLDGARHLVEAGVFSIVLESVVPATARLITDSVAVPTIGIGCGHGNCDGEVAVVTDVIGSFPWFVPPFAKPEADVAGLIREAARAYVRRVSEQVIK
jgi:3-methyl-2-oxobutanoate hydroxymethyltransferase